RPAGPGAHRDIVGELALIDIRRRLVCLEVAQRTERLLREADAPVIPGHAPPRHIPLPCCRVMVDGTLTNRKKGRGAAAPAPVRPCPDDAGPRMAGFRAPRPLAATLGRRRASS